MSISVTRLICVHNTQNRLRIDRINGVENAEKEFTSKKSRMWVNMCGSRSLHYYIILPGHRVRSRRHRTWQIRYCCPRDESIDPNDSTELRVFSTTRIVISNRIYFFIGWVYEINKQYFVFLNPRTDVFFYERTASNAYEPTFEILHT